MVPFGVPFVFLFDPSEFIFNSWQPRIKPPVGFDRMNWSLHVSLWSLVLLICHVMPVIWVVFFKMSLICLHCIKFIKAYNVSSAVNLSCVTSQSPVSFESKFDVKKWSDSFLELDSRIFEWCPVKVSYGFLWSTAFCFSFYCPILLNMLCVTWCHVYKKVTVDYVLLCGKSNNI